MELTDALYSYKSKAEVDEMVDVLFQRLDGDKNGYIEFEEFLRACLDRKKILKRIIENNMEEILTLYKELVKLQRMQIIKMR